MKRWTFSGTAAMLSLVLAACGGGDAGDQTADTGETAAAAPAATPAGSETLSMPAWMTVDEAAHTVTIDIVAGQTDANNHWNFNGHSNGDATIVVPEGYAVTVNFRNDDPANVHSLAVIEHSGSFPAMFNEVSPVFAGAATSNATSMTEATAAGGGTETITFTADAAGEYALACLIPAHAVTGMWMGFEVSASGEAGVRM